MKTYVYTPPVPREPVVCIIHQDHLTIQRNGRDIGMVLEVDGKPVVYLDRYETMDGRWCALTFEDINDIQINWNVMKGLV